MTFGERLAATPREYFRLLKTVQNPFTAEKSVKNRFFFIAGLGILLGIFWTPAAFLFLGLLAIGELTDEPRAPAQEFPIMVYTLFMIIFGFSLGIMDAAMLGGLWMLILLYLFNSRHKAYNAEGR